MAEQTEAPVANANTTELEVPKTMHIDDVTGGEPKPNVPLETSEGEPSSEARVNQGQTLRRNEIAAKRMEVMRRELELGQIMADEERSRSGMPPLEEAHEEAPAESAAPVEPSLSGPEPSPSAAPAPGAAEPPKPSRRKVKVYGQEIEVDPDQEHALIQKGVAYDHLARQVAEMRKQPQPEPTAHPVAQPPQQSPQVASIQPDDAHLAEIQRRISYGNDDEQKAGIRDLLTYGAQLALAAQGPQVPPEQLVRVATDQAKAEIRFESNLQTIGSEFPEIFADDELTRVAALRVGNLRAAYEAAGIQKDDLTLYREAASGVRDKFLKKPEASSPEPRPEPQPTPTAQAAPPSTTRLERKRAAPQPPASASQRATAPDTYQAPSPKSVVAAMRKARHQPAMN